MIIKILNSDVTELKSKQKGKTDEQKSYKEFFCWEFGSELNNPERLINVTSNLL